MELQTPFPGTRIESATFITSEDCQGHESGYWRATAWDSTGACILACVTSLEGGMKGAERKAMLLLEQREHFLRLSVETKLEWILKKYDEKKEPGNTIGHEEILKYLVQGLLEVMRVQKELIQRGQKLR